MLIRFKVKNFLSFDEEEEISMISGKVRSKQEHLYKKNKLSLLKFTAIFGANAAGKSNLVTAMDLARHIITREIPPNCINHYFRINEKRKKENSKFEFEIVQGGKYYAYGFELVLNERSIKEEWLYELKPDNSEKLIFKRDTISKEIEFSQEFSKKTLEILKTYSGGMVSDDSILFLTEMNRNKGDLYEKERKLLPFREVYRWFERGFVVNYPDSELSPAYFLEKEKLDDINTLLPKLGLGITQCKIVTASQDELQQDIPMFPLNRILDDFKKQTEALRKKGAKIQDSGAVIRGPNSFFILKSDPDTQEILIQKLQMEHEKVGTWFEINEESDGTRRIFDLIELIISAKVGIRKVYVIDEIDRCLHPQLTYKLIKTYLDLVDQKEIQLIVTTHESHLMDLNMLRRDEIWFVEKNTHGSSHLYSLDQYNERFDKKIERAYLDGRYGGVPLFDKYFPLKEDE